MAYFDIDDTAPTPDSEAENRRRVLAAIASSGKPAVLGQPAQPSQPNIPTPRLQPTEAPSLGSTEMFGNKPPALGTPPILPGRPNVMPTREDFPAKPVPTWQKVLGIAAAPFLPNLTTNILGRPQREAERAYQGAVQDYTRPLGIARTQAETREMNARAASLENPPGKPENLDREAYDFYVSQGMTPAKARQQVLQDAADAKAKEPVPPKENKAVAGTLNGKPAWGVQTDKGWVDPQTQKPIPTFAPAPTYAETGNYDPVQVTLPGGGMGVGTFNRRTGTTTIPPAGTNAPIPKPAQKEIDTALDQARNMDRLESAQQKILTDASKRKQTGPAGGGPYLDGPESMQFLSNHIAMTFGGVKGARIGRDLIQEHINARDLDQATEALAQRILAGGVIPYSQAQQMISTTKINRQAIWNQAKQTASQYGVPDAVKMPDEFAEPSKQKGGFKKF